MSDYVYCYVQKLKAFCTNFNAKLTVNLDFTVVNLQTFTTVKIAKSIEI